jgi:mannose-6-phosphate isomerase-like protein (cupin superfamily)
MADLSSRNFEGLEAFAFEPRKVEKPWGYELIWAHAEGLYVGKILFVKAGSSLSLQFHNHKDETWHILSGRAEVEMGAVGDKTPNKEVVTAGAGFRITPGTIHRVTGIEDTTILEASTPHLDDIVRLEDLYGRIES